MSDIPNPRPKGRPRILPIPKRTKVSRACDLCKHHKRKCNGDQPCFYCKDKSLNCTYLKADGRSKKSKTQKQQQQGQIGQGNSAGTTPSTTTSSSISEQGGIINGNGNGNGNGMAFPGALPLPDTSLNSIGQPIMNINSINNSNNNMNSMTNNNTMNNNNMSIMNTMNAMNPMTTNNIDNNNNNIHNNTNNTNNIMNNKSESEAEIEPEIPSLPNSPNSSRRPSAKSSVPNSVNSNGIADPSPYPNPDCDENDELAQVSLSMICKSLQTALSNDDNSNIISYFRKKKAAESKQEGLSNLNGQHTRLLCSQGGDTRFFGESSALSLVSECRALFLDILGESTFTNDPQQQFIHDELVDFTKHIVPVQLPRKEEAKVLIDLFKTNINDTFYVFNMRYLNNMMDEIYSNPILASTKKLCLLHLVFAIGVLFVEYSPEMEFDLPPLIRFLESAEELMRNNIYDGKLWMVEANFLKYFYFQACCNRSNSWISLGTSIRFAQALGMHRKVINDRIENKEVSIHRRRLWRSLYVCDCVSSVNLGRPLMINTYDYDDINFPLDQLILPGDDEVEKIRIIAQNATSDSAVINRLIIDNNFKSQINLKDSNSLALQLKLWSIELPPQLQLSKTLEEEITLGTNPNNYLLVFVHIGQLYGIMALTRPFLVYVAIRKLKPKTKREVGNEKELMPFCKAAIKAAFLCIKLIKAFCTNTNRKEVFTIQSATFFAAILLGFTLLEQSKSKKADKHYMSVIKDSINDAITILKTFPFNATCNRWSQHLIYMLEALNMASPVTDTSPTSSMSSEIQHFNDELVMWNNQSNTFEQLLNFQQYFVPNDVDILNNNYLDAFNYTNSYKYNM
ncbi:MAG: fungal specific transcription factor domain-containing protein [Asgard group archaeon]|nr:fungal specific transcription factor domain-containing protein [Asgard group archaeon]